jgi:hypothetical protein
MIKFKNLRMIYEFEHNQKITSDKQKNLTNFEVIGKYQAFDKRSQILFQTESLYSKKYNEYQGCLIKGINLKTGQIQGKKFIIFFGIMKGKISLRHDKIL